MGGITRFIPCVIPPSILNPIFHICPCRLLCPPVLSPQNPAHIAAWLRVALLLNRHRSEWMRFNITITTCNKKNSAATLVAKRGTYFIGYPAIHYYYFFISQVCSKSYLMSTPTEKPRKIIHIYFGCTKTAQPNSVGVRRAGAYVRSAVACIIHHTKEIMNHFSIIKISVKMETCIFVQYLHLFPFQIMRPLAEAKRFFSFFHPVL